MMIIEERKSHELNLEAIDKDLRMENVRFSAEKMGWEDFNKSVRRNLMGKRNTLEAGIRLDVLNSLSFMTGHLPIDNDADIYRKIQQLADGIGEQCSITAHNGGVRINHQEVTIDIGILEDNARFFSFDLFYCNNLQIVSCKIGYFGQPLSDAPDALELMKSGEFSLLRDSVVGILSSIPKELTGSDKDSCKDALRAIEHILIRNAADSSFKAINTSKYGFYSPRTELFPGRIYFVAGPDNTSVKNEEKTGPDNLVGLPYFEISFVEHDKKCQLPVFSQSNEWTIFKEANACIRVKFNQGLLISQHTIRKLARIVPKAPLVRHYVNFYGYIAGRAKNNMKLLTQFPAEQLELPELGIQQYYEVDENKLKKEDDAVVVEMFLSDVRELPKLIEILRSEWMHASLWVSVLAMCEPQQEIAQTEVQAVKMQLAPRRDEIQFQFDTEYGNMIIMVSEKSPCHYSVKTMIQYTGESACSDLDEVLTQELQKSWNIPLTLTYAVSKLKCRLNNVIPPLSFAKPSCFDSDKLQHSLSALKTNMSETDKAEKKKKTVMTLELGPAIQPTEVIYTRENDEDLRGSLLSSFGEVDQYYIDTSTIGKTRAQPRPTREPNQLTSMGMMSAELDIDKGRQQLENSIRQQEVHRMSHLESARVHMKQSIGAAHAVGLASHQPHIPPGGPMRHNSYTMGFDPPAPYDPNIPASIQFPDASAFGKGKQRKPRAKKQLGEEGSAPSGRGKGRKGRGASSVASGGRKSTGVVPENLYGMDQMRPPLQRSFSDFPGHMNPQQMSQYQQMQQMQQMQQYQQSQHYQQSQQYRMQMQQHQMSQQQMQSPQHPGFNNPKSQLPPSYTDEDSESKKVADEECDPPPPPKPQVSAASRTSVPPHHQLGNPMIGYPGMPLQSPNHLPLTPSPLSAPPKPFSPEQQNLGMRMREQNYWREDKVEMKPDIEKLKQQMAANSALQSGSSDNIPSTTEKANPGPSNIQNTVTDASKPTAPINNPPMSAPTPKKKLGLEAAISKIRGQQEQALQKQQQQRIQQQESVESVGSEQPTPQPVDQNLMLPPLLAPNQLNRARNLNGVFDDEADEAGVAREEKPQLSALQRALSTTQSDSPSTSAPQFSTQNLKKEVEEEPEKGKLIVKIPPKILRNQLGDDRREERKEKDRERDRDFDRDRDRERGEKSKEDKTQREKDKKDKEKERRRLRDRERAEQKKAEKDSGSGKEKDSTSSKKRKFDRKEEKDRREPDKKKSKTDGTDHGKTTTATMPTNFSLKNFRIPKKDTAEEERKDGKDDPVVPAPSASLEPPIKKDTIAAPVTRKESAPSVSAVPPLQRKESFTTQPGTFPAEHHREPPSKKKPISTPIGPSVGIYQGPPTGSIPNNMRGNNSGVVNRKQPMPPPPQMMRGPPPDQMYRERAGSMRGFPPSSHYHGSGGSGGSKQVASYAQGLPPGMGPPAVKPHGNNYQASQWVRPPTHRDSHSYHGMSSLGPPHLQREQPPPPPQMTSHPREQLPRENLPRDIPLRETFREQTTREPQVQRESTRERNKGDAEGGPDSPEEGCLRIDDE
ncbi:unnamed protein product [Caenorhabditis brenneri]